MPTMAAVKASPPHSSVSPASSPEATAVEPPAPSSTTTQKRKGGRKPVYATQEERKMRNRAAQAAFRERRTEYIKQLEATIKQHEEQLAGLQNHSRQANDECLMLRYKNSLLERILMEKGVDVHTELNSYPPYDPRQAAPPPMVVPQAVAPVQDQSVSQQQAQMQSHLQLPGRPRQGSLQQQQQQQHRRSIVSATSEVYIKTSPTLRGVSGSRDSSPTVAMPTPPDQTTMFQLPQSATAPTSPTGFQGMAMSQNYYPSPFQANMEELEQEFDRGHHLENNDHGNAPSRLDQQPTPDGNDGEIGLGSMAPRQHHPASHSQQHSLAYGLFDNSFDSIFGEPASNNPAAASIPAMMRQHYGHAPFNFATSNLR